MKIPESIRIGGVYYAVVHKPNLNDGKSVCYGQINFEESTILLNSERLGHQKECCTFWHEIIHGIVEHANIDLEKSDEESIVDTIAKGVYQVLQDNGRVLFDIRESD